MNAIVTQMIILFIIVIIGYFLSKKKMMDADFDRKLSVLVINVTCPSLILSSVMGDTLPDKGFILPLLVVGFATYAILIGGAFILPRFLPVKMSERGIYSFMLAFRQCRLYRLPYRSFYLRGKRGVLCLHPQLPQHLADIRVRHIVHIGRRKQDTL